MSRYRTEIVIPPDRYVCLQLPGHLPAGRAVVIVQIVDDTSDARTEPLDATDPDPDREDIEWWDEFDGDTGPVR